MANSQDARTAELEHRAERAEEQVRWQSVVIRVQGEYIDSLKSTADCLSPNSTGYPTRYTVCGIS